MGKIDKQFYIREDVVGIARNLIGKYLYTQFDGGITAGIITETEAYEGVTDRASHAFGNRRTNRTEVMFAEGGLAYVYLCYGVHSLFNIVTNKKDTPHAVLIRGILPVEGLEIMRVRSGKSIINMSAGTGPGNVSKLLGIHFSQSGTDLSGNKIWLEDKGLNLEGDIIQGTRIGVQYAGDDALLPYRFRVKEVKINR